MKKNRLNIPLEYWMGRGVKILHTLPEGWQEKKSACNAPDGYMWISNGKPMFSEGYELALLKV